MYRCLTNGLSFKVGGGNVLTLCPPLTITREELDAAFMGPCVSALVVDGDAE